jgi:hypothetical protein
MISCFALHDEINCLGLESIIRTKNKFWFSGTNYIISEKENM